MLGGSRRRQHGDKNPLILLQVSIQPFSSVSALHTQTWTVYSTHMLGQVLVCFNWLWEQFLRLAADLWSRSPPTRQIFSENSNLSTGGSRVLRFTAMPTVCFCPSLSHLVSYSHICVSVLFPVLCLQAVQHFVIAEVVCVCVCEGGQQCFWSSFICFYCAHFLLSWIY